MIYHKFLEVFGFQMPHVKKMFILELMKYVICGTNEDSEILCFIHVLEHISIYILGFTNSTVSIFLPKY